MLYRSANLKRIGPIYCIHTCIMIARLTVTVSIVFFFSIQYKVDKNISI